MRLHVHGRDAGDDRKRPGTKADRRDDRARAWAGRAVVIIACVISAYAAGQAFSTSHRVSRDEHASCIIQARQLPAGHQLAAVMTDLHELLAVLLTLPPASPSRPVPKPDRQRTVATGATGPTGTTGVASIVLHGFAVDLNGHLVRYLSLEAQQPSSRHC